MLYQTTKPHGLFVQFPNRQKGNIKAYDYIDTFLCRLKEDIGEPIATRYFREITVITIIDDENKKLFLPKHSSNHQYYA